MEQTYSLSHEETLTIEETLGKPGGVIAFPTDTVYGLGCLPENEESVEKIYTVKQRDTRKPLILLGHSIEILSKYVKFIPDNIATLMNKHWPGALTIILPRSRYVPDYINADLDTIGIRVPGHALALEILKRCTPAGVLATTSANISGTPDIIEYDILKKTLGEDVDYLVEEYDIELSGLPSTIIALNKDNSIKVLRQGAIVID
jgi:L-threonylcarbamoyladenylate synthase